VASGTIAAGKSAVGVVAHRRHIAVAVAGRALVDVDTASTRVSLVAKWAVAAREAAGRVRALRQRIAAAVVLCAFVDVDAFPLLLRVASRATAAGKSARCVVALGQRVASPVLACALIDVLTPAAVVADVQIPVAALTARRL
jgi:hypothetical protein